MSEQNNKMDDATAAARSREGRIAAMVGANDLSVVVAGPGMGTVAFAKEALGASAVEVDASVGDSVTFGMGEVRADPVLAAVAKAAAAGSPMVISGLADLSEDRLELVVAAAREASSKSKVVLHSTDQLPEGVAVDAAGASLPTLDSSQEVLSKLGDALKARRAQEASQPASAPRGPSSGA